MHEAFHSQIKAEKNPEMINTEFAVENVLTAL